jgi:putative oxidoreductase
MNAFLSLGRWFFALPFSLFGLLHLLEGETMAQISVPSYLPVKVFWVYFTGIGLIAAAISMLLGKLDKLATILLAIFLLFMVFLLHIPNAMAGGEAARLAMGALLKDISLAGGAMMYAKHYAQDTKYT